MREPHVTKVAFFNTFIKCFGKKDEINEIKNYYKKVLWVCAYLSSFKKNHYWKVSVTMIFKGTPLGRMIYFYFLKGRIILHSILSYTLNYPTLYKEAAKIKRPS